MKKAEKKVVEVKEVYTDVFGYAGGVLEYTPASFDKLNVPEEQRFTAKLLPMSDRDCSLIRSINSKLFVDVALYESTLSEEAQTIVKKVEAKLQTGKKKSLQELTPSEAATFYAIQQHKNTLDDICQKFEIAFKYIDIDGVDAEKWALMHNGIREDLYNKLIEISNVTMGESINLL